MSVLQYINEVPNFPKQGMVFLDISPVLKNHFSEFITECADAIAQIENIDYFVGIEARGFILAAALAERFQKGLLVIRKKGKLPPEVLSETYELEYSTDTIEMQKGTGRICIIDDVLATGGTLQAACKLATNCGYTVVDVFVAINITKLNKFTVNGNKCKSLLESK
ncbi:MAG: adenine phosphoribosyltransferase [Proteobacteria bacterium]|jgi:adenine phosphoribosyltransferase|nr:adenine phosphoribosyltransferase [Pseudomonadota bacterium]